MPTECNVRKESTAEEKAYGWWCLGRAWRRRFRGHGGYSFIHPSSDSQPRSHPRREHLDCVCCVHAKVLCSFIERYARFAYVEYDEKNYAFIAVMFYISFVVMFFGHIHRYHSIVSDRRAFSSRRCSHKESTQAADLQAPPPPRSIIIGSLSLAAVVNIGDIGSREKRKQKEQVQSEGRGRGVAIWVDQTI